MISMDKKYRTRDGQPARVLCVDRKDPDFPVVALVGKNEDRSVTYTAKGRYSLSDHCLDLIEISPAEGLKVDDPVWVRNSVNSDWVPRHFDRYEDGKFYTWFMGMTSHTTKGSMPWSQLSRTDPYKT